MQEKTVIRNNISVTEVRSAAGKLLYVKTGEGYEFKCPRSKQVYVVPYAKILSDCLQYVKSNPEAIRS